jgi:shikimate kinase
VLALVGLNGSGKSAIAAALAHQLGGTWFDTDRLLTQHVGRPLTEILACDGEAYLRAVEGEILYDVLHHMSHSRPCVIATGCSIVMREANRRLLQRAHVTWLDASTPMLLRRLALSTEASVQPTQPAYARIESLRAAHAPYYRALAGQPLNTDAVTAEQAAELILSDYERLATFPGSSSALAASLDVAS